MTPSRPRVFNLQVVKLLVGNKIDKDRVVERELAEEWARSKGMIFLETSAKTNVGIKQAFQEVVEKILENPLLLTNTAPGKPKGVGLNSANDDKPQGGCC